MEAGGPSLCLVLASASPRRRKLLEQLGIPFEVVPADVPEEIPVDASSAEGCAATLALRKARSIADQPGFPDAIVLAADTVVAVYESGSVRILGKPGSAEEARAMLRNLSGRTHAVHTGVALAGAAWSRPAVEVVTTEVRFRPLSPAEIDAYVATGEPYDKAGGYGIQGGAAAFVEHIRGDYYNVVGLPLARVRELLSSTFPRIAPAPPPPVVPFAIIGA